MNSLKNVLAKKISIRSPFDIINIPLITKLYNTAFTNTDSSLRRFVVTLPLLLIFYLLQRYSPFKPKGTFSYKRNNKNKTIFFDARNTQYQALYKDLFHHGYEPEVMALLDIIMPSSGTFYDIGANWGYFSMFVASKPDFKGKILAFEPFPSSYQDLKNVIKQAELTNIIECYSTALSNFEGNTHIQLPDHIHSGFATIRNNSSNFFSPIVKVTKLDTIDLSPSVLKIDVEGSEYFVLIGGRNVLVKYKPMIIFENIRDLKDTDKTLKPLFFLKKMGYTFFIPCWLKQKKSHFVYLSPEDPSYSNPMDTLALVPMTLEKRFLYYNQINIFACHKNNLPNLYKLFNKK